MSAEYEWVVTDAGTPHLFKYRVALYRIDGEDRDLVGQTHRDTVFFARLWAKRKVRADRLRRRNGGAVARGHIT